MSSSTDLTTEADISNALTELLKEKGYSVQGEVRGIDLIAIKEDQMVAFEIKKRPELKLIYQLVERQERVDQVYAVVMDLKSKSRSNRRQFRNLVKRLGAGLIWAFQVANGFSFNFDFHPNINNKPLNKRRLKKQLALQNEIDGRLMAFEEGGLSRAKKLTAYRQQCILVAYLLSLTRDASPKEIRDRGGSSKTTAILSSNFYGWFQKIDRGRYSLSIKGQQDLESYTEVINKLKRHLEEQE